MTDAFSLAWPPSRVVEAIEAAARHAGIPVHRVTEVAPTWGTGELAGVAFDRWVEAGAGWLGVEAEPVDVQHADVASLLLRAAPALVRLPPDGPILVVVGRRRDRVLVIAPDLEVKAVPVAELRDTLCRSIEAPVFAAASRWLDGVITDARRNRAAREAIASEVLQNRSVTRCYLVRLPASASMFSQAREVGVVRRGLLLVAASATQYVLGLAGWYTLGAGVFGGGIDRDWLIAWALILATGIPIQVLSMWLQGDILLTLGALLKRRLLAGSLRIDQDALRKEGAGQLLGRALDASTLESLALSGALFSVLALVELVVLAVVLALGPGGALQVIVFVVWSALTLIFGWRNADRVRRWTRSRRDMTGDLVEQMAGHRTRLAQQSAKRWHDGEDEALERYFGLSAAVDRHDAAIRAMPQAWYLVGLAAMLPSLMQATGAAGLAIAVGGVVLGGAALARLSSGLTQLAMAASSWKEIAPIYHAAEQPEAQPSPDVVAAQLLDVGRGGDKQTAVPILDATELTFSYPGRPQPVLRGGAMRVNAGDRILVEGTSGGGKSTFASLLAGLRRPQSGLLLLEGLDWQTVGPIWWRRRVAASPQYHDNHVLSETFLFNLLLGRQWPPTRQDIADAVEVCQALGLGDLLRRMPAGLMQMLGESGWRLSHGERSRLFIARALLQNARVIILDESFAALDPKTVDQCLRCVFARAPALIVIAHP